MSSGVETYWHGQAFREVVIQKEKMRAKATAKMGERIAKTNMQPSPGPVGANPSAPGEYPAIQTNTLYQNIHSELYKTRGTRIAARWGVYARYAKKTPEGEVTPVGEYAWRLEAGIGVAARPWLTMSMAELKQKGWVDGEVPGAGAV